MSFSNAMGGPAPAPVASNNTSAPSSRPAPAPFRPASASLAPAIPASQQQAAVLLNRLYAYFQGNLAQYPALGNGIPATIDAVNLYSAGLHPQALTQTLMIYQWIYNQAGTFPPLPLA